MTQDQASLPYTINPGLAATITSPLPRASLDGRIDNTLLNLVFTARPLPKLNVAARYRYDDRDNKTPQAFYNHIPGDSQLQGATLASSLWRANLPISYRQNLLKLDARYRLVNRFTLNAGYHYEETKRTFVEVNKTREHTYRIGLRRSFSETVNGGISYAHTDRKNKGYDGTVPYFADHTPEYVAGLGAGVAFENHPYLRKFNYADRKRDKVRLSTNASPHEMVGLQFRADFNRDDYKNTGLGFKLTDLGRLDIGGDNTYSYGVGKIDTTVGSALTAAPMPDLESRLNRLQLYGKYKVQKNATIKLSYWHQKLKTSDWSMDNVKPTTLGNVLTTGQLSPNYSVNVVGISLIYKY